MKILLVLTLALTCALANQCIEYPASMNSGVSQSTLMYEDFLYTTNNETDPKCGKMGCCPKIVTYPASKGSVIQPFSGFRGNVAIIVDWGGDPTPCNPYRRRCTVNDGPFVYYINWGDGTNDHGYQAHLGPFQKAHQYPQYCKQYGVTVYYCSAPGGCPYRRCCDSIYRVIDVSYDPQNPHPDVQFEQF